MRQLLPLFALATTFATNTPAAPLPGLDTSTLDPATKGHALVEELNCVACHQSDALASSSRRSPRLANIASRLNPDYLQAFIASPHQTKPGTLMPDLLHHLPADDKTAVAESITHFLASLNKGPDFKLQTPDAVAAELGQELFHSVGCVSCHSPRKADGTELLPGTSVPLGDLSEKYTYRSLNDFLKRPHNTRPSGRMPDLRLPGHEVDRITHYLLQNTTVPGHLAYTTWRGKVWEGLDGDVQKEKAGHVDDFSPTHFGEKIPHHTAIQYSGFLDIDTAGDYTFHLELNGVTLRINGEEILTESPSDRRGTKKLQATAKLDAGWNQIELTYFHTGRNAKFVFEMQGPGFPRGPIPASRLSTSETPVPVLQPLEPDPALAAEGKAHFQNLGCAQCHDDLGVPKQEFTTLAELDPSKGCLTGTPKTPHFDLTPDQRKLVATALPQADTATFTDLQHVNKTLAAFNCIACHDRDGLGGVSPDRNAYFTGTAEALGDQGRVPPPLTHVGAKLTRGWLEEVMLRGGRQRQYLNTRMPLFGDANVAHLIDRFARVDSLENASLPKVGDIKESKNAGYEMVGTRGLSCIACHDFNGQKSTAGALELVGLTERLQKNWFHLYMRQPSRFHPTVIMPSYWPGGQSVRPEILAGNTDQQIEALWNYLSDGTRAKTPVGLSRQSPELRVADQTLMCRGRGTAGYRGIGVGYPERISLAFDTEEMAVRLLWKGEFASVNHGSFRARGNDRIPFPAGIPFHRLESLDDAWPYKGKTDYLFPQDHGYQYRGYTLDSERRPTFNYHYGEIAVTDYFHDHLDSDGNAFFRRTLTFTTPQAQKPFYFRAAAGKQIKPTGPDWQIDRLTLKVPDQPTEVRQGDPTELLLPLTLPAGTTTLNLEYHW